MRDLGKWHPSLTVDHFIAVNCILMLHVWFRLSLRPSPRLEFYQNHFVTRNQGGLQRIAFSNCDITEILTSHTDEIL